MATSYKKRDNGHANGSSSSGDGPSGILKDDSKADRPKGKGIFGARFSPAKMMRPRSASVTEQSKDSRALTRVMHRDGGRLTRC